MKIFKKLKNKKEKKIQEEILKYGLVLLGFNFALALIFFFGFIGLMIIGQLIDPAGISAGFLLLLFIYLFAGGSGVVWYRFGQIIGRQFKERRAINASLIVLISVLPMMMVAMIVANCLGFMGGFADELVVVTYLALLLMSLLSVVFELFVVCIGAVAKKN